MSERAYTVGDIAKVLSAFDPNIPVQIKTETTREPEYKHDEGEHALVITISYEAIERCYGRLHAAVERLKVLEDFLGYKSFPRQED